MGFSSSPKRPSDYIYSIWLKFQAVCRIKIYTKTHTYFDVQISDDLNEFRIRKRMLQSIWFYMNEFASPPNKCSHQNKAYNGSAIICILRPKNMFLSFNIDRNSHFWLNSFFMTHENIDIKISIYIYHIYFKTISLNRICIFWIPHEKCKQNAQRHNLYYVEYFPHHILYVLSMYSYVPRIV